MPRTTLSLIALLAIVLSGLSRPAPLAGQQHDESLVTFSTPADTAATPAETATPASRSFIAPVQAAQSNNNKTCFTLTFEGLGDGSTVPEFEGVTFPGWQATIDRDLNENFDGNIAREPSPSTVVFMQASSSEIVFEDPVAEVGVWYSSNAPFKMEAFDGEGNSLAVIEGPDNFNRSSGDPGGAYNTWFRRAIISDPTRNFISKVVISGGARRTAIDNLRVCEAFRIDGIEFTQGIQEYQTIEDLEADLQGDGEPPVALVEGKPAVMRIYMNEVGASSESRIKVSGIINAEETITVIPDCEPEDARRQECDSVDFYFTPPSGELEVKVEVFDRDDELVEDYDLTLMVREVKILNLYAVKVCDEQRADGSWHCAENDLARLSQLSRFVEKISPTYRVQVLDGNLTVRHDYKQFDEDGDGKLVDDEDSLWSIAVENDIVATQRERFLAAGQALPPEGTVRRTYGMIQARNDDVLEEFGGSSEEDRIAQTSISLTTFTQGGVDVSAETVAHEIYHTLGLLHTGTDQPGGNCIPAVEPSPGWPFPDNYLQSQQNNREIAFDVAEGKILPPDQTFDVMAYCQPHQWPAPFTYNKVLNEGIDSFTIDTLLNQQAAAPQPTAAGDFWLVSGTLDNGALEFDSLFTLETTGPTDAGSGDYVIEVRDASDTVLFSRAFEPQSANIRSRNGGADRPTPPSFGEFVPVQAGAASIVVRDPGDTPLGTLDLAGDAPAVTITAPQGGATLTGEQELTWTVNDPDSSQHTYRVDYTPDGSTWRTLVPRLDENRLRLNVDDLPGGNNARIRVRASDGVNTGSAVSDAFTVPPQPPTAEILSPAADSAFDEGQVVVLQAYGFDPDDRMLPDDALQWSSDMDGNLGTGQTLAITTLSSGVHTITLRATDSDDNAATDSITLVVDGVAPRLNLLTQVDTIPTSCVLVRADVSDIGSGVERVDYSVDGGETWAEFTGDFALPGTGYTDLVVRTVDRAGNWAVAERNFFIAEECTDPGQFQLSVYLPLVQGETLVDPALCDSFEPDDSPTQASAFPVGETQQRALCVDGDADWVTLTGSAGESYTIETLNLASGVDTVLEIYDTDGSTLLGSDDNGGAGAASRLVLNFSRDGTALIRVSSASGQGGSGFRYDLRITRDEGN